jgi:hypothetical protein
MKSLVNKIYVVIIILLISDCQLTFAQSNPPIIKVKWDFIISTGIASGGPADDFKRSLFQSGYSQNLMTKRPLPFLMDTNWTFPKNIGLGINICFITQELYSGSTINSSFRTTIVNPYLSYNYGIFSINAGPSLNKISYWHPTYSMGIADKESFLKAGFILKSSLNFPQKTLFFLHFEALYSLTGTISPDFRIKKVPSYTLFHAEGLSMNYFYGGIGLGIRLLKISK